MRMHSPRLRNGIAGAVAVSAMVIGIAAPAFAGTRSDTIDNRKDGWSSDRWNDGDSNDETRVTVRWCTREFRARIRKDRTGLPDPTIGSEWINCRSYDDAVRSDSNPAAGKYHYDINGMDSHYGCDTGFCDYRTTAGADVYW